jgi:hypothetical protein
LEGDISVKVSVAIMAHPDRSSEAIKLSKKLHKGKFHGVSLIFDDGQGEWETGVRALRAHVDSDWHIVIQDDAIISESFYTNVIKAIENVPEHTLLSFYTGTVRPFPSAVKRAVTKAMETSASYLSFPTLNWGVAYAIPTDTIEQVLLEVERSRLPYDERIGRYYLKNGKKVYYTAKSIVDHNYKLGSLVGNDRDSKPRKAHVYEPKEIFTWNKKVVEIK